MSGNKRTHVTVGPLNGVRVLEMGSLLAGPFCAQLLGDFGAEVVKVEPPKKGDPMRMWGRHTVDGRGLWWSILSRNKKCITLDLRTEKGQELARKLASKCDIVVENFRPGRLERWNLGYEQLREVNPRVIMVRVSGYGQTGPYRGKAGFGSAAEAMGGIRHITGHPDRPPTRVGISLGDSLAGTFSALGAVMALYERDNKTGSEMGQVVDVGIYEAVFAFMESLIPEYQRFGVVRERTGTVLPGVAPSNTYKTRDGDWIVMGANADAVFRRLCETMQRPELASDPRFANHHARAKHSEELDEIISSWMQSLSTAELLRQLDAAGVPASQIYTAADIVSDPHYAARDMLVTVTDPELGPITMQGIVPKLSRTPGRVSHPGPFRLGDHNEEIYEGLLGLSREDVEELEKQGII